MSAFLFLVLAISYNKIFQATATPIYLFPLAGWYVCLPQILAPLCPFLFPHVGWCIRLPQGLVSVCLPLYPILFAFVGCWFRLLSGLVFLCKPLVFLFAGLPPPYGKTENRDLIPESAGTAFQMTNSSCKTLQTLCTNGVYGPLSVCRKRTMDRDYVHQM